LETKGRTDELVVQDFSGSCTKLRINCLGKPPFGMRDWVLVSVGIFLEAERNDELNKMVACNLFCEVKIKAS
jgi:hydrogenase maturation factor